MIKFSVNQAQDEMGFQTAIRSAQSAYTVLEAAGLIGSPLSDRNERRHLPGVEKALERETENPEPKDGS